MVDFSQVAEGQGVPLEQGIRAVTEAAFGLPSDSSPAPDGEAEVSQGVEQDSQPAQEPFVEGEVETPEERPPVPFERFGEVNQQKRDLAEQLQAAQREIAELKEAQRAGREPNLKGEALDNGMVAVDPAVLERARELAIQDYLQTEHHASPEQARTVAEVWKVRAGAVSVEDAYHIAKSQSPDLFAPQTPSQEPQVHNPNPSQAVNRPGPSRMRPQPTDTEKPTYAALAEQAEQARNSGASGFQQVQASAGAWAAYLRENNIL